MRLFEKPYFGKIIDFSCFLTLFLFCDIDLCHTYIMFMSLIYDDVCVMIIVMFMSLIYDVVCTTISSDVCVTYYSDVIM